MYLVYTCLQPPFPFVVKQKIKMTLKLKKKKNIEKLKKVSFSSFDIYSPFEKQINEW